MPDLAPELHSRSISVSFWLIFQHLVDNVRFLPLLLSSSFSGASFVLCASWNVSCCVWPSFNFLFPFANCLFFVANLVMDAPSCACVPAPENSQAVLDISSTFDWSWCLPYAFAWLSLPPQPAPAAHCIGTTHPLLTSFRCSHSAAVSRLDVVLFFAECFRLFLAHAELAVCDP
jgi:hypothetical protein